MNSHDERHDQLRRRKPARRLRCGDYFVDYVGDWHDQVWVHKREYTIGSRGGSDTTDYAYLSTGQSYSGGGYTFTNMGNGKVIVKGAAR